MNQAAIVRIAAMTTSLRPDWPQSSVVTLLTKHLAERVYQDVAVAMAWVATDPDSQTPARILEQGPWWAAVAHATGTPGATYTPTAATDMRCPNPRCGSWVVRGEEHQCRPTADPHEGAERVRAALADARAGNDTEGDE